jgi:hypothetical protein
MKTMAVKEQTPTAEDFRNVKRVAWSGLGYPMEAEVVQIGAGRVLIQSVESGVKYWCCPVELEILQKGWRNDQVRCNLHTFR